MNTYHTVKRQAGTIRSDHQWDIEVRINSPALVATLKTSDVILQFSLVQLVNEVSLKEQVIDSFK